MKKLLAITLCAAMVLSFAACSNGKRADENFQNQSGSQAAGKGVQIPNPFEDCENMSDAEKIAGFTLTVPEKLPEGHIQTMIQASENDMIKIFFENGEKRIEIRKAKGDKDISGVYTVFDESNTIKVGSLNVSTKGNDGKVNLATWIDGEYAYSITANIDETGLDVSAISDMAADIR